MTITLEKIGLLVNILSLLLADDRDGTRKLGQVVGLMIGRFVRPLLLALRLGGNLLALNMVMLEFAQEVVEKG